MNPVVKTLDQHKKANKEITATTANMAAIYRQAREWLNNQLRKFVLSKGKPSEGKYLVELINELERNYGKLEESFVAEMKRAIPYVAESYYFDALHDLGNSVLGKIDKNKIEIFQKDAFNHIAGMTQNMIKSDVAFIRQASADVFRLAGVNGMTAEQTKEMLLGKILTRPEKFQFVDAGGHVWDNESYCKMLSRTVLLNAGRQSYFDACAANGNDVVRVTVSGNPCPACAVWENRLLSISGATDGLPTVEQATAAGLCHPNCTHSFVAVGEFARQEDFSADGRPKEGVNSPGREEKDNPEAWKKYRKSLKPEKAKKSPSAAQKQQPASTTPATPKKLSQATAKPANGTSAMVQPNLPLNGPAQPAAPANQPVQPAKKETPEEHRAKRQAQWEAAYDKRRDAWYQQIIKDGGSKEVAGAFADAYTPAMAKLGKPPKIVSTNGRGGYFWETDSKKEYIKVDMNNGHAVSTAQHEFGHWQDRHSRFRRIKPGKSTWGDVDIAAEEFNKACESDWNGLKERARTKYKSKLKAFDGVISLNGEHPEWNTGDYFQELSIRLFGEQYYNLDTEKRYILAMYKDTVGSITKARYGAGHSRKEYERSFGNGEAYANAVAAWLRKDIVFQVDFPDIWNYIDRQMRDAK